MADLQRPDYADLVAAGTPVLINGAVETRMRFGTPWTAPPTVDDVPDPDRMRSLLALQAVYATIAREYDLPILLFAPTTPTSEWLDAGPDDRRRLARRDRDGVDAMRDMMARIPDLRAVLGAIVFPTSNPYDVSDETGRDQARSLYRDRVGVFTDADVDLAVLAPWPSTGPAVVALEAVVAAGLPATVSFLLDADGDLLDGTPLATAIRRVDAATEVPPLHYAIQCVHPRRAARGLERLAIDAPDLLGRVRSVRANAADRDVGDLDESATLQADDPETWAVAMADLHQRFDLPVLGGCCGTDERHTLSLALRLAAKMVGEATSALGVRLAPRARRRNRQRGPVGDRAVGGSWE